MSKLLILTDDDQAGGTANVARRLAIALATEFEVEFGYNFNAVSETFFSSVGEEGISIHNSLCRESNAMRSAYRIHEAVDLLDRSQPDVILFVDAGVINSHLALKQEAGRRRIPYVSVVNGVPDGVRRLQPTLLSSAIDAMNASAQIVLVSEANRRKFATLIPEITAPTVTIANSCAASFFEPASEGTRSRVRRALGIAEDEVVVLVSARVEISKGQHLLIEALHRLRQEQPGAGDRIRLVFAGEGAEAYLAGIRQTIEEFGLAAHVVLLGYRSDIPDLLAAADIFALPSLMEGMPISILEAMATGLPVLATAVDGIPEQVDESTGILVPSPLDDEPACLVGLVPALATLSSDGGLRRRLGDNGRRKALEKFHPEGNAARYAEQIRSAAAAASEVAVPPRGTKQDRDISIDFSRPEQAWQVLDDGWSASGRKGTWNDKRIAALTLVLPAEIRKPVLIFRARPAFPDRCRQQSVRIKINDVFVGAFTLRPRVFRKRWLHLPVDIGRFGRRITLTLEFTDMDAAKSEDARRLRLNTLRVEDANRLATRLALRLLRRGAPIEPTRV